MPSVISSIRAGITTAGGSPTKHSVIAGLRELVTAMGATPAGHSLIPLLKELMTAAGGAASGQATIPLLREIITQLGGTPTSFMAEALWEQLSGLTLAFGGGNVTIAAGKVSSDLTNFPVLVDLSQMPPDFWSAVDADGGNIRVLHNDAAIPFDLCMIDTAAETGLLVFLAPSLLAASSNSFLIDLSGNGLLAATDPNGREAVWADYAWVSGFDGTALDRTGNSTSVTGTAVAAQEHPGFLDFTANTRLYWGGLPHHGGNYTLACSYDMDAKPTGDMFALLGYTQTTSEANLQTLQVGRTADAIGIFDFFNGTLSATAGTGSTINTLYRAAATVGGGSRQVFLNGAQVKTGTSNARPDSGAASYKVELGSMHNGSSGVNFMRGEEGYAYLRFAKMSAAWLAAEAANWNSPATFCSISAA